jgi:hypothetical protein
MVLGEIVVCALISFLDTFQSMCLKRKKLSVLSLYYTYKVLCNYFLFSDK